MGAVLTSLRGFNIMSFHYAALVEKRCMESTRYPDDTWQLFLLERELHGQRLVTRIGLHVL